MAALGAAVAQPAAQELLSLPRNAISGLNESDRNRSSTGIQTTTGPAITQGTTENFVTGNPQELQGAKEGITNAAGVTRDVVAPVAENAAGINSDIAKLYSTDLSYELARKHEANRNLEEGMNYARQKLYGMDELAQIDPNRYVNSMGLGSKILTGIGMVLSGAGSGLSGQPNLAYDYLNKQIDRDIQAQQKKFDNGMAQIAKSMDMSLTYQDQANLHAIAANLAGVQTTHASLNMLNNAVTLANSKSATELAKPAILNLSQLNQDYMNKLTEILKTTYNVGSEEATTAAGLLLKGMLPNSDNDKLRTNVPTLKGTEYQRQQPPFIPDTNLDESKTFTEKPKNGIDFYRSIVGGETERRNKSPEDQTADNKEELARVKQILDKLKIPTSKDLEK